MISIGDSIICISGADSGVGGGGGTRGPGSRLPFDYSELFLTDCVHHSLH